MMPLDRLSALRRNVEALRCELAEARDLVAALEQDLAEDLWEIGRLESGVDL